MENKHGKSKGGDDAVPGHRLAWKLYAAATGSAGALATLASPASRRLRELTGRVAPTGAPCDLWVHACSAGEMLVARRFIDEWREATGRRRIFVTAWTKDGHTLALDRMRDGEIVSRFPLDSPAAMRRAYDGLQPACVVLAETELWPNHLREARARNVPVFVINGRMPARDLRKYRRLGSLAADFFRIPETVFAQSEEDAGGFRALGAREVVVSGNMKFDALLHDTEKNLCIDAKGSPFALAASTHAGEEALVMGAFSACRRIRPEMRLVVAPRHIRRAGEIVRLAEAQGLRAGLLSRGESADGKDCLVVDRLGLLPALYRRAEFAVVGKSFAGRGGQNFLEAVQAGCPVLIGPHTENFDTMLAPFLARHAVWQLSDAAGLAGAFAALAGDPVKRSSMAGTATDVLAQNRGATRTTVRGIARRLGVAAPI